LSAQLAKWLGKEPSRGPNESNFELEGIEGTLPTPGIPSSRVCLTTKGKIYIHSVSSFYGLIIDKSKKRV